MGGAKGPSASRKTESVKELNIQSTSTDSRTCNRIPRRFQRLNADYTRLQSAQSQNTFGGIQCREQLTHGEPLPWQDQIGRDFAERLQHESAQVRARVRQFQTLRIAHFLPKGNQVEIQRSRFVEHRLGPSTELPLQRLKLIEQVFRGCLGSRQEADDRVDEQG